MVEVQASGDMDDLQAFIAYAKAREILWSYVAANTGICLIFRFSPTRSFR